MNEFEEDLLERLSPLGLVRSKAMFGGLGIYCGDAFFAIVWRGALYFKVDAASRSDYERAGMDPFRPFDDKPSMRGYYEVPPQVYEQTPQLQAWARRAVEAAKAKKKPARRARKRSQ